MDDGTMQAAMPAGGFARVHTRFAFVVVTSVMLGACAWPMYRSDANHTGTNMEGVVAPADRGSLTTLFTVPTGGPVFSSAAIVDGIGYVGSLDGKVYAFDAKGVTNCGGTPKQCAPLWTGQTTGQIMGSPAVVDGVVYITSDDGMLQAFDAAGQTSCSGTPTVCQPLWSSPQETVIRSSPVVANGVVYIGSSHNTIEAFDAAGATGCSGTPKVCQPLWQGPAPGLNGVSDSTPAVANGLVYVGARDGRLYAFDATGSTGCGGTPKVCQPVWTAVTTLNAEIDSSPTVADGFVYINADDEKLYAFDPVGVVNCTNGAPRACSPIWVAPIHLGGSASPAVARGILYVTSDDGVMLAFDAAGSRGCSGTPTTCLPLWTGNMGGAHFLSSPAVANGTVYIGSGHDVFGFDQDPIVGCGASGAQITCNPLWTAHTGGFVQSSPAVSNGIVYVGSGDGNLYAYGLPPRS
jgi:outer membrane protein assembly factor BamB